MLTSGNLGLLGESEGGSVGLASCSFKYAFVPIIGERERANLVVQLARFFYIYIYRYISGVDVCRNVLRNSK